MASVPDSVLDKFRENGYYVQPIAPYNGDSYAIVPKDEVEDLDELDLNKLSTYNGFSITTL